jgi:hypothetical protein
LAETVLGLVTRFPSSSSPRAETQIRPNELAVVKYAKVPLPKIGNSIDIITWLEWA